MSDNPTPPARRTRRLFTSAPSPDAAEAASGSRPDAARTVGRPARTTILSDPLTGPFFICLVAGSTLAVMGHLAGFELIGLFGPIFFTAAYPIWGLVRGIAAKSSLRERFADNSYYLGFIFTQVALLAGFGVPALLQQPITSEDVLRFFGVAIGASMTGLVARTLLVQTGHNVTENADIVQDNVEELAQEVEALATGVSQRTRGMLGDLDAVAAQLAASRKAMGQELDGWVATVSDAMKTYETGLRGQVAAFDDATAEVGKSAKRARGGIDQSAALLSDRIKLAAEALDRLQHGLDDQVGEASRSIQAVRDSFVGGADAVNRLQVDLGARMAEATDGVRVSAHALSRGVQALQGLSALDGMVGALDGRVSRVGQQIDQLGESVRQATVAAGGAGDIAMNSVQGAIDSARVRAQEKADALGRDLDAAVGALESVLERFRQELERVRV